LRGMRGVRGSGQAAAGGVSERVEDGRRGGDGFDAYRGTGDKRGQTTS